MNHFQIEERSLALHQAVASKIRRNPALLNTAKQNLERWISDQGNTHYWSEWRTIFEQSLEEVLDFLVSREEKAVWLRQSSPFCGILTPLERWKIYESFTA
ncbi:MAG: hypothetical protein AB1585_02795 [Thermodesulfobacteriota bacterium]